ncbi:MAG: mandelate racemase/muconate lactonizing enzyme family protein [Planctomycetia bacterium]|nr:mandelate racemase/muconate lactonizing enzyme family protein [Planctomycetia bacterium]
MKIEAVDFFYLSMPEVRNVGDGSQDALLVRVQAGGCSGWGECEAAPLVSIASWVCPMSHSACKPIRDSVLGQRLEAVDDVRRINALVRQNSLDLLQTDHTLSGIDVAMWDLLAKKQEMPVYRLLGYPRAYPKTPYASQLFGDDPAETHRRAGEVRRAGFTAAKFGWGPFGRGSVRADDDQVQAAREGLGDDAVLLVDVGTVWGDNVAAARLRLPALRRCRVGWLEEPFVSGALASYRALAAEAGAIRLAGGEGCRNFHEGRAMVDHAALGCLQIDAGRVGGITTAKDLADYARGHDVRFVNHTFTTSLALSASLQPFAGIETDDLCEYPVAVSSLAAEMTTTRLVPGPDGRITLPDAPGLGIEPDTRAIRKYLVDVHIELAGKTLYRSPTVE